MTIKAFGRHVAVLGALLLAAAGSTQATEITGAGSTFVFPILSKWSASYSALTGDQVNYQSIGSGGGIAQIKAATVTFGASDMPLKPADLTAAGLGQFPVVVGGVVPVVNLDGVSPGQIRFTGPVLAGIYLGTIKNWNDPAIAALNPGLTLPDEAITVVHRSDGSGTTFNWVDYLCKVSPEWKSQVGEGTSVQWPVGVGGKGNEGVAAYVNQLKGSIGYVELAYVMQTNMDYAAVKNRAGRYVEPSISSFQFAAAHAHWTNPDFYEVITDAPGARSWPIAASTFLLMYKHPKDPGQTRAALAFFKWALEKGQSDVKSLNYVSLPPNLARKIEAYWAKEIR